MDREGISDEAPAAVCDVEIVSVYKLLNTPGLQIPSYQRPYQWTGQNIRQLIEDIREFSRYSAYRIGSVILHHNREDNTNHYDIVDGQQRIISFIILVKALLAMRNDKDNSLTNRARNVGKLEISRKDSRRLIVANYRDAISALQFLGNDSEVIDGFLQYLLDKCEVLQITVNKLDEAFQMFDSQNARGKALEPTDLLKAFHIRVMERAGIPRDREYDLVNRWESIPDGDIPRLFRDHLYRIRQWSFCHKASDSDYAAHAVDMFHGIDPDKDHSQDNWTKIYMLAWDRINEYARENRTLTKSGIIGGLDYPFQIDQPVINGEQFFLMTEHYYQLAQWLGIFSTNSKDIECSNELSDYIGDMGIDILDTLHRCNEGNNWWRYRHMRNLFDCLMLYYIDRFGTQNLDEAIRIFFIYAATLRLQLRTYRFISTNKYVIDGGVSGLTKIPNAFAHIHDSIYAHDALDIHVPTIELASGEKRSDIFKLEDLDNTYNKATGHTWNEERMTSSDTIIGKPFSGVNNESDLQKRVRELAREGFTRDVILLSMQDAGIIQHKPRKQKWEHVGWFPYDRKQSIRNWISDVIEDEKEQGKQYEQE